MSLDAHARPPESMRTLFKKWQKSSVQDIDSSQVVIDFSEPKKRAGLWIRRSAGILDAGFSHAVEHFLSREDGRDVELPNNEAAKYESTALPGLIIYPSLLCPRVQVALIDKLLHRDLSNQCHQSNLHLHYNIAYSKAGIDHDSTSHDGSFFLADQAEVLLPKDPGVHKPLTIKQMLERKLRWMTLGGQYDWTAKKYPQETPPPFPEDIAHLLKGLFPDVDAQAAIVNFYTPGDTLSVHRDVSEECDRSLISISIGCDGLFIIGNEDGSQSATIRLKSGDVVLMSGPSRYAWHAVPKILSGTCPTWLHDWPAGETGTTFEMWRGWMADKRINLNVRQMQV